MYMYVYHVYSLLHILYSVIYNKIYIETVYIVFFFKQLYIVTRYLQAFVLVTIWLPGTGQSSGVPREDEGGLALWERVFYHWNCFSIIIRSRAILVTLIIVLTFFLDNIPPRCLNLGPPYLQQSLKAQKWPTAGPSPNAESNDHEASSVWCFAWKGNLK